MKKIVIILLMAFLIMPSQFYALQIAGLKSANVIIYNRDENKILYEKNSETETSIASLTKIATVLVAIENIENLDEKVIITEKMLEEVPYDASIAGLEVGDEVTYRDLLYGIMLPSGADAADAIAISTVGSINGFVEKMNELATKLNLEDTHFVNTTGYDEIGHYSTAKSVMSLLNYALENETFKEVYTTKEYTMSNGLELESTLISSNERWYDYDLSFVLGSKTGTTDDAGICLSTLSNIEDTNIITVTINAPYEYGYSRNIEDLITIKEAISEQFDKINLVTKNETVKKLETKYAKEKEVEIVSDVDITRLIELPYKESKLKIKYNGEEIIKNTTKKGTKVGTFKVYYDGQLIDEINAYTKTSLTFSLWAYLTSNIIYYIILAVLLIGTIMIIKKPKKGRKNRH